jgi:hypothetical protein
MSGKTVSVNDSEIWGDEATENKDSCQTKSNDKETFKKSRFRIKLVSYAHNKNTDELEPVTLQDVCYINEEKFYKIFGEGSYQNMLKKRNKFKKILISKAEKLKNGEEIELQGIIPVLYRYEEESDSSIEDDDEMDDLAFTFEV